MHQLAAAVGRAYSFAQRNTPLAVNITGIIDDVAPLLGALLVASGLASRFLEHRFQALTRLRTPIVVMAAAGISVLFIAFLLAAVSSASPGLERYDVLTHPSVGTWYCLSAVVLTFLPVQLLWWPRLRKRPLVIMGVGMLTLLPSVLAILSLRSSAEPFYFASDPSSSSNLTSVVSKLEPSSGNPGWAFAKSTASLAMETVCLSSPTQSVAEVYPEP